MLLLIIEIFCLLFETINHIIYMKKGYFGIKYSVVNKEE